MPTETQRKWSAVRISAGDYLLPNNDRTKVWRVASYEEDGSASWVDSRNREHVIRGTVWAIYRPLFPLSLDRTPPDDFLEWHLWEQFDSGYTTKRDAMERAATL